MAGRLNLAGRSFNTNNSLPALEETNLAILSHPNLDDNAQFKELKGYLSKYYQDRRSRYLCRRCTLARTSTGRTACTVRFSRSYPS